jgi:hypothetical protein
VYIEAQRRSIMNLIERISNTEGIIDFKVAPDEVKLQIYELALKEIGKVLLKENLLDFPKEILKEFLDSLREIISGFYELNTRPINNVLNFGKIIPIIITAQSHLLTALSILKDYGKTFEYFEHLQDCTYKIFETLEYL